MKPKKELAIISGILIGLFVFTIIFASLSKGIYSPNTISTHMFRKLSEKHNDFLGMDIDDVISLLSTNNHYFYISFYDDCYEEFVMDYPEIILDESRPYLYYFATHNKRAREEIYPEGFYVDTNGIIIGRTSCLIHW